MKKRNEGDRQILVRKKNKPNFASVMFWVMIYLGFIFIGFIMGMVYQQLLIVKSAERIIGYTDIDIDINFNATKFTEELNRTFIPAWKQAFNETMYEQLNLTNKNENK